MDSVSKRSAGWRVARKIFRQIRSGAHIVRRHHNLGTKNRVR